METIKERLERRMWILRVIEARQGRNQDPQYARGIAKQVVDAELMDLEIGEEIHRVCEQERTCTQ